MARPSAANRCKPKCMATFCIGKSVVNSATGRSGATRPMSLEAICVGVCVQRCVRASRALGPNDRTEGGAPRFAVKGSWDGHGSDAVCGLRWAFPPLT